MLATIATRKTNLTVTSAARAATPATVPAGSPATLNPPAPVQNTSVCQPSSLPSGCKKLGTGATTVAGYQAYGAPQGLKPFNPADPFCSDYAIVIARNTPNGAPCGFAVVCEAMLRARGLIYFKNNPGDCGTYSPLSNEDLQDLSLASSSAGALATGIGAAGIAVPGLGAGIAAGTQIIAEIFEHHSQAVQVEQTDICQVAGLWNQVMAYVDSQVYNGTMDPSDGATVLSNYAQELNAQLQQIEKVCDAACLYQAILKAHVDFASSFYYPAISPDFTISSPSNPAKNANNPTAPLQPPTATSPVAATSSSPAPVIVNSQTGKVTAMANVGSSGYSNTGTPTPKTTPTTPGKGQTNVFDNVNAALKKPSVGGLSLGTILIIVLILGIVSYFVIKG